MNNNENLYTLGKRANYYDGKTKGQKFTFNLKIESTMLASMPVQLFNVLKSVISNGTTQNGTIFYPFTLDGYELIIATGNAVTLQANGDLNYRKAGGTFVKVSTPSDQNLTYQDVFAMLQSGSYFKLNRLILSSTNKSQLTSGVLNVLNVSDTGTIKKQSIPTGTFFSVNQDQNFTVDMDINTEICKNQGLEITVFPTTTIFAQFFLEC